MTPIDIAFSDMNADEKLLETINETYIKTEGINLR